MGPVPQIHQSTCAINCLATCAAGISVVGLLISDLAKSLFDILKECLFYIYLSAKEFAKSGLDEMKKLGFAGLEIGAHAFTWVQKLVGPCISGLGHFVWDGYEEIKKLVLGLASLEEAFSFALKFAKLFFIDELAKLILSLPASICEGLEIPLNICASILKNVLELLVAAKIHLLSFIQLLKEDLPEFLQIAVATPFLRFITPKYQNFVQNFERLKSEIRQSLIELSEKLEELKEQIHERFTHFREAIGSAITEIQTALSTRFAAIAR